jgi:hypothetical protein
MFTDERRSEVWDAIRQQGIRSFASRLTPAVLAAAAARTGVRMVNSPLNLATLVWLGVASAIHVSLDFATILTQTLQLLEDQPGFSASSLGRERQYARRRRRHRSKHSPHRQDRTQVSEEAFCKARLRMPLAFWFNLIILLGELFEQEHAPLVHFRGFRLLAMDGTEIDLPQWKALRDHFGQAKNKFGLHQPQARMVMLQLALARLPYRYELCPLSEGEITIARRLVRHLRPDDLVLLDAGFWSYGLMWDIQHRGAYFALRLRGGVNLQDVRSPSGRGGRRSRDDRRVTWTPKDSRGQWRRAGLPRTIELRVIRYQVPGFRVQQLVTNLLDVERMPRADWVRLTTECRDKFLPGLYHRRWEIETTYRELKVEQGLEAALRSRTPDSLKFEVAGHVVLYLLVRWLIVEAAVKHDLDPLQLSFTQALRELNAVRDTLVTASPGWAAVLLDRLLDRIAKHRVPFRPGRHYVRKKKSSNHKRKSNAPKANATQ